MSGIKLATEEERVGGPLVDNWKGFPCIYRNCAYIETPCSVERVSHVIKCMLETKTRENASVYLEKLCYTSTPHSVQNKFK